MPCTFYRFEHMVDAETEHCVFCGALQPLRPLPSAFTVYDTLRDPVASRPPWLPSVNA